MYRGIVTVNLESGAAYVVAVLRDINVCGKYAGMRATRLERKSTRWILFGNLGIGL